MKNLSLIRRVLSFVVCSAVSVGIIANIPSNSENEYNNASAEKSIEEIQAEREANNQKIAELESQIDSLEGDKANEQQFQNVLTEQIGVIQANINLLNNELDQINTDILSAQDNIVILDETIELQQKAIDEKIVLFKARLRNLYISGNENFASILIGSASFYDMLSRVEMVNRIAASDEQLIEDILAEINEMENTKLSLQLEKDNLELHLADQQARKQDKDAEMGVLYDKMAQTQSEIDRLSNEQVLLSIDKEELRQINADLEAEEEEIKEAIRKAAEEAQRRYEEELRRQAEEEARRRAEEEARRKAEEEEAQRRYEEELRRQQEEEEKRRLEEEAQKQQQAALNQYNSYTTTTAYAQTPVYTTTTVKVTTAAPVTTTVTYNPPVSSTGFMWPAPGFAYISSPFGSRWGTTHRGIDVGDAGIHGARAVASRSGTVVKSVSGCTHNYAKSSSCGCGGGYGNYVVIAHDGTYSTLYGHLTSTAVSVGQYVNQGETIGYIGCTGFSTGSHLHFEVLVNGSQVDPSGYVSP